MKTQKYVFTEEDVPAYDSLDISELIQELRRLDSIKKEVELRHKVVKNNLMNSLKEQEGLQYQDGKYYARIQKQERNTLDSNWVKKFAEEQGVELQYKKSEVEKLETKRID